jgi:hypothetical protein
MTADERLALIRVKVDRARKHISDLQAGIRIFMDSDPYVVGTKPDPQIADSIKYYILRVRRTPNSILLISGDILFNLRAALDHLAWQLAVANGESPTRHTCFPIFDDVARYKTMDTRKLKGMSHAALDAISATTPYHGGNDTLWRLQRLNNIDKHRFLITAGSHVATFIPPPIMRVGIVKALAAQEGYVVNVSDKQIRDVPVSMRLSGGSFPLKVHDELELPIDHIPDMPEFKNDARFTFEIALNEPQVAEREPLLSTLVGMADGVDDLIASFKPLLT